MSNNPAPISDIGKNLPIKTEVGETHSYLIADNWNVSIENINVTYNLIWRLLGEINNSADHNKRLRKAHRLIKTSELLLQLVSSFEIKFNINPDYSSLNKSQIGSLIWYRGVLDTLDRLRNILMAEAADVAADGETAAIRFGQLVKAVGNWQRKAQGRYPNAS